MSAMEPEIMVSVIVLTYNHEKYIRQALDSILMQKVDFKYEILVGDDCSTDETPSILLEYQNKYPDIFCARLRQKNIGATKNLYELLMSAQGKYIAYLEGDDYWFIQNKLQYQVEFLERNIDYIACTHECCIVDENGKAYSKQYLSWISQKKIYTIRDFQGVVLPGHGNSMLHRNIFLEKVSDYKDLILIHPLIADRALGLLLASKGKIYKFSYVMGCYRRPLKSQSATTTIYEQNVNRIQDDYIYTKKIEAYAISELCVNGGFSWHKKDLFVSALYAAVKHPSKKTINVVKTIFSENNKMEYVIYIPFGLIKKLWAKYVKKEWSHA